MSSSDKAYQLLKEDNDPRFSAPSNFNGDHPIPNIDTRSPENNNEEDLIRIMAPSDSPTISPLIDGISTRRYEGEPQPIDNDILDLKEPILNKKPKIGLGRRQLRAMLTKNFLLKRRAIGSSCCELTSPLLIILVIVIGWIFSLSSVIHTGNTSFVDGPSLSRSLLDAFLAGLVPQSSVHKNGTGTICFDLPNIQAYSYCLDPNTNEQIVQSLLGYEGPTSIPSLDEFIQLRYLITNFLYNQTDKNNNQLDQFDIVTGYSLGNVLYEGKLIFAPDSLAVHELIDCLNASSVYFKNLSVSIVNSEQEGLSLIQDPSFGRTLGFIVFHQLDILGGNIDFSIKMNYTLLPSTQHTVAKFYKGLDIDYKRYYWSGFLTLQNMIDNAILNISSTKLATPFPSNRNNQGKINSKPVQSLDHNEDFIFHSNVTGVPFPLASYTHNSFYDNIGPVIALILCLSMLFPVSRLVRSLVEEKEQKSKEVMKIMGLQDWVFVLSWFITYATEFTLIAIFTTVLLHTTIFPASSFILILVFLLLWVLSLISFAFMIQVFFSKAKLASVLTPILLFALTMPRYAFFGEAADTNTADDDNDRTVAIKSILSLLSPTAFAFGADIIIKYESASKGLNFENMSEDAFSFSRVLLLISLDIFLYSILAWYLENVWPNEYGSHLPIFFCFSGDYWSHKIVNRHPPVTEENEKFNKIKSEFVEPLPESMMSRRVVEIKGLRKIFPPDTIALKHLYLDLYEGQIVSLLGHNGAGKTTFMQCITGLISPSSGDCIINGLSLTKDLREIRKSMGICPQHDVLFSKLTVYEHLILYASLKGLIYSAAADEAESIIKDVGLDKKRDALSNTLSGGMKRKLSIAIALIGGSKLVFLDEPTSGMDPYSRRSTWDLLRRSKENRVIVLTTHFMDEADLLSDRIAVLANGRLRCVGSSLFLKSRFGIGYNLTLVKSSKQCNVSRVIDTVLSLIPSAQVLTTVGGEMSFQLPLSSVHQFASLFRLIEKDREAMSIGGYGISMTTLEECFLRISESVDDEDPNDNDQTPDPPVKDSFKSSLFRMRYRSDELHRDNTNVPLTHSPSRNQKQLSLNGVNTGPVESSSVNKGIRKNFSSTGPLFRRETLLKPLLNSNNNDSPDKLTLAADSSEVQTKTCCSSFWVHTDHFFTLLYKRFINARRDLTGRFYELIVPVLTVALALCILQNELTTPGGEIIMTGALYSDSGDSVHSPALYYSKYPVEAVEAATLYYMDIEGNARELHTIGVNVTNSVEMSNYLLETAGSRRYGAMVYNDSLYFSLNATDFPFPLFPVDSELKAVARYPVTVLHNTSFYHALPVLLCELNAARYASNRGRSLFLQYNNSNNQVVNFTETSYIVRNSPLPVPQAESLRTKTFLNLYSALFVLVPFCYLPASFVLFVVKERTVKSTHLQLLSGVHPFIYWSATFTWDFVNYLFCMISVMITFVCFSNTAYVATSEAFGYTFALFFFYGSACIPLSYCYSLLFNSYTGAQVGIVGLHFITGFLLVVANFIIDNVIEKTNGLNDQLKTFYRFFPPFTLGEGLIVIATRDLSQLFEDQKSNFGDWNVLGRSFAYLICETFLFTLIILFSETEMFVWVSRNYYKLLGKILSFLKKFNKKIQAAASLTPRALHIKRKHTKPQEDIDVNRERKRIEKFGLHNIKIGNSGNEEVNVASGPNTPLQTPRNNLISPRSGFNLDSTKPSSTNDSLYDDDNDLLRISKLRKVYGTLNDANPYIAVHSLSLGVKPGECFGFLGINGAGKTTTIKMLTSDIEPTSGTATIAGFDIRDRDRVRHEVGYCPQFDPLLDLMTAREQLTMYAHFRSIPKHLIEEVVNRLIRRLGLSDFADHVSGSYSGGNKRKLSLGLALIGEPSVLFLDEPSTGMDPVSRRFMWSVIAASQLDHRSVILTTHSMEECEALCGRIGIMVSGRLVCLGSIQHLKSRFGDGYHIEISTIEDPVNIKRVRNFMKEKFESVKLEEKSGGKLRFLLTKHDLSLANIFDVIELNKSKLHIYDYSVSQSSLEQVFLLMARKQKIPVQTTSQGLDNNNDPDTDDLDDDSDD